MVAYLKKYNIYLKKVAILDKCGYSLYLSSSRNQNEKFNKVKLFCETLNLRKKLKTWFEKKKSKNVIWEKKI